MKGMLWAVVLLGLEIAFAEITIVSVVTTIYDRSPKLRIKGTGFDADAHDTILELSTKGEGMPNLIVGKDFTISKDKDNDGLILKLLSNRRWVNLDSRTPPVALILKKVYFSSDPSKNLLPEPAIVANVVRSPSVSQNLDIIFSGATSTLRINGTGFIGVKKVDLYFNPPLYAEISYEMVSKFPLLKDQIVLKLRDQHVWRAEPGPLSVVGIDTGGGPVKQNGADGITVAVVQANLDLHGVTVETTAAKQLLYHDDPTLVITGEGFNPQGNTLRFSNGILGKSVNYSSTSFTETSIKLKLQHFSSWRKNMDNLPGVLNLLAVNAGEGFVAVGPRNTGIGRDVATIFERPDVHSNNTKLYRTQSHELHISGTGFPRTKGKVLLKFNPPLIENTDYTIRVISRFELEVTLMDGKQWRSDAGPLQVTQINTRGDEAGWVKVGGETGEHVAEVLNDIDAEATGGVVVIPMSSKVYQSALQDTISIRGNGFKEPMSFTFEPDIKEKQDYTMKFVSASEIVLKLLPNKKWSPTAGFIILKTFTVGSKSYPASGNEGVRVATIFKDPSITPGKESFHQTQSKVISISGTGFTNVKDTKITIGNAPAGSYKIMNILEDTIRLQLTEGSQWLNSYLSLKDVDENKKIPLEVTGIDTGAGAVVFDKPVTIGFVVKDREGVVCDDSCQYAFNGVCDDGSEGELDQYYEQYGYYQSDDLGGYGGSDGTEGERDPAGGSYAEGYGEEYSDYNTGDDGFQISGCYQGTDCTDCGGVDKQVDYSKAPEPGSGVDACTNTCVSSRDGVCDDPRAGSNYCAIGTDCQDCGPVGMSNFTKADDDGGGWWDDDDDYWTFNDNNFLDQAAGLEANRGKIKNYTNTSSSSGPGYMFLVVLEGMVYTVAAIFAAATLYLGMRWYKGQEVPCLKVFDAPTSTTKVHESELRNLIPITPDVIRTQG